jgi:hypothetical protein
MRTTVDITDDIMKQLRSTAHRQGASLKDVLNTTLRRGMQKSVDAKRHSPYRCPTFSMGEPKAPFDIDKALAAAAACEDSETARKLELRK